MFTYNGDSLSWKNVYGSKWLFGDHWIEWYPPLIFAKSIFSPNYFYQSGILLTLSKFFSIIFELDIYEANPFCCVFFGLTAREVFIDIFIEFFMFFYWLVGTSKWDYFTFAWTFLFVLGRDALYLANADWDLLRVLVMYSGHRRSSRNIFFIYYALVANVFSAFFFFYKND